MSIYDEVVSFIDTPRPELFEPLALAVFRYQFENVPVYKRFCKDCGSSPESTTALDQIPPASTLAFKYAAIQNTSASASTETLTFLTSGTTKGFTERGRHLVPQPRVYRASAIAHLRQMLFADGARMAMLALHPTSDLMPESSLSAMLSWCIEEFGTETVLCAASRDGVDTAAAVDFLHDNQLRQSPVCILGTTAASAKLFESIDRRREPLRLPTGSRLMDTGGAKGQQIPLTPAEVVARAQSCLGIDPNLVINEYGMTEMCSQLYDATPFNSALAAYPGYRVKLPPPWLRPTILDPVTLKPMPKGQVGLIGFFDLANVGSISALVTEDLGFIEDGAVAILGRTAAGGARGCALSIEEFARREMDAQRRPSTVQSRPSR
jgi:hypothetical protein